MAGGCEGSGEKNPMIFFLDAEKHLRKFSAIHAKRKKKTLSKLETEKEFLHSSKYG